MLDLGLTAANAPAASAFADVTAINFEREVLAGSNERPVVVQFWAPWCGPCKQLKPLLEKAVTETKGAVQMVRVNIDEAPDLAQALRVQSVPMIYAFYKGQPVDGFVGARPDSEVKAFVAKLAALNGGAAAESGVDLEALKKEMAAADAFFAEGNIDAALAAYSTAYDMDATHVQALAGIAWCFVATKEYEAFDALCDELTPEQLAAPAVAGLQFLRVLRQEFPQGPEALAAQVAANEKDQALRYDLARAQMAAFDLEGAVATIIASIRLSRDWDEGRQKQLLLALLDALGPNHPLTKPARRQLSALLFS